MHLNDGRKGYCSQNRSPIEDILKNSSIIKGENDSETTLFEKKKNMNKMMSNK